MMRLSTSTRIAAAAALLVAMAVSMAGAEQQYVSLNGGFYITIPDSWAQVDYRLVDSYLLQSDTLDSTAFDYEAVFAQKDVPHFFSGEYLILTIDTAGKRKDWQIDSILIDLVEEVGEIVHYSSIADFLASPQLRVPCYDTLTQMVALLDEVSAEVMKKSLSVMKFYDKGIASFYFYVPDSAFESGKTRFEQVLASFSTDVESALSGETLKVADIDTAAYGKDTGEESGKFKTTYLFYGVALVLILLIIIRRLRG